MNEIPGDGLGRDGEGAATAPPFTVIDGDPASGMLLICDHASNAVPAEYRRLGLSEAELRRHIAYDIGAGDVTRGLAERLGSPAILSTFSRLLIDANRGEDDPTLIMRLSDGALVPGNTGVDAAERAKRIARFHAPYHAAIDTAIDRALSLGSVPIIVSVHSFTPIWRGVARPWQVGILSDSDRRLAEPLIAELAADAGLAVGDNEPYRGALANDCLYRHGTRRGLAHALIEIRQDLIANADGVAGWVSRLVPILSAANALPELHVVQYFASLTGQAEPA